ncbi:MAG: hypothetical protein LBQ64_05690 [Bacteroidales bacterium]|jgi:hypothetical protein|nr:hypothetical protein [Bacteroidales bacterium]
MKRIVSIEDLPVIADFVIVSLRRDLANFSTYSPKFNDSYLDVFEGKIAKVKSVIAGKIFTKELSKVTINLKDAVGELRPKLNKIEGYVKMADKSLSTTIVGFGISAVRQPLNRGNVEGVTKTLGDLLHIIENNRNVLSEQGLSDEMVNVLRNAREEIERLNNLQNQIISQRAIAVEENSAVFDDLWKTISETLTAGRSLYKGVDAARIKDYTLTELEKKLKSRASGGKKESTAE